MVTARTRRHVSRSDRFASSAIAASGSAVSVAVALIRIVRRVWGLDGMMRAGSIARNRVTPARTGMKAAAGIRLAEGPQLANLLQEEPDRGPHSCASGALTPDFTA